MGINSNLNQPEIDHLWKVKKESPVRDHKYLALLQSDLPEVLFVTSFPPRECGIATYTQDLIRALNTQFENSLRCSVCALESNTEQHLYCQRPKYILNTDIQKSFEKTANKINTDKNIKLVIFQHEFGLFSSNEIDFRNFFKEIVKPIIFVFHTVLPCPGDVLKLKVQEMAASASTIVVMTNNARKILLKEYEISADKLCVIPHGTHLVTTLDKMELKKRHDISDRKILSTFGLLSSGKSIETTLDALPQIVKAYPDILFLILGKTHPAVVKQEGEKYRNYLEKKVEDLNIKNHVKFINEYLPLHKLLEYLQLTDIYLFTSKDPNQAVSGTFSYAASCGCPVISTPIPHAIEVLDNNSGIIIDFENSEQLSNAVISLFESDKLRNEISSNSLHKMASTAWQNSAINHAFLFEKITMNTFKLKFRLPDINLRHLRNLTTDFGIIQFSKFSIPDLLTGYTLDDNARALIAVCKHYELFHNTNDLNYITTYLSFIKFCIQSNGFFLNYVNFDNNFSTSNNSENLEDSNGRAIWALGYLISLEKILPPNLVEIANSLLNQAMPNLDKLHSTRAMAFSIKGLYYQNKKENIPLIQLLANRLIQMYKHEKADSWHWFENYLTYGNSVIPESMLCAFLITNELEYKDIAKESFEFLLSKTFVNGKLKVISNKGWLTKKYHEESQVGGEQPIDVAYTIISLEKFYSHFKKIEYRQKASIAFNWFLGENHLNQVVYNPATGGCYDGVEEFNVNLNQGAESTISYLIARLTMEYILNNKSLSKFTASNSSRPI